MTSKSSPSLPRPNFVVPKHYKAVDMSSAIKGISGACGLPTPERCGIDADTGRLARYTALFQEAERLYMPSGPSNSPRDIMNQTSEALEAIAKAWEYLEPDLKHR